ncbi:MAG: DUF4465 domain-containing protein [Saprospiraceae bacterium]|nr:DUF4465 domain-containing protein [Saprospiraceae bacterium]
MKKHLLTSFLCLASLIGVAQTLSDFETQPVLADSFLNGSDMSGGFEDGNIFLPNSFNPDFNSWSGWAISNQTDTLTPGFMNQHSASTGSGYDGSSNFAIFFSSSPRILELRNEAVGNPVEGFYISNNTYAYLSMRDGDSFAKKFGGVTGDDPDYFLLTIKGFYNGELSADSVDFYLADYRFDDNTQDYIVKDWTYIDLLSLGSVDSLQFSLSSTDNGMFGMNTPAYFVMDNFTTTDGLTSTKEVVSAKEWMRVYPNPSSEFLRIRSSLVDANSFVSIYSLDGSLLQQTRYNIEEEVINIQNLPKGSYLIRLETAEKVSTQLFIKS